MTIVHLIDNHNDIMKKINDHSSQRDNITNESSLESLKQVVLCRS